MLECSNSGLEYTIEDHDITLRITEGAVAPAKTVHFEMGVATYGPFIFPQDTRPISPILWLCPLEKDIILGKFQIILPHLLSELTKQQLCDHQVGFAKANHNMCTSKNDQIEYHFNPCEIQPLFASSGSNSYGVLVSNHCCFYCIVARQNPEVARNASYCLARIESLSSEIYFVASFFLKSCIKVCYSLVPSRMLGMLESGM